MLLGSHIFLFQSKLDTKIIAKSSEYLYFNNEIEFYQRLKMIVPSAERRSEIKNAK